MVLGACAYYSFRNVYLCPKKSLFHSQVALKFFAPEAGGGQVIADEIFDVSRLMHFRSFLDYFLKVVLRPRFTCICMRKCILQPQELTRSARVTCYVFGVFL